MRDGSFEVNITAIGLLLLFGGILTVFWLWSRRFLIPHIKFSNLQALNRQKKVWKEKNSKLPFYLMISAFAFFSLAFIDPHFYLPNIKGSAEIPPGKQVTIPTEGIAIYLVLDQSGSMSQEVKVSPLQPGGKRNLSKLEIMKEITREFIKGNPDLALQGRPNDLVGLISFARGAQVLSPLTLDHGAILNKLAQIDIVRTPQQDGTAIGYAIFKTANLIAATRHYAEDLTGAGKPAYEIKSAVMIVVTDGFQSPSPLDQGKRWRNIELFDAAKYARENDIRVYVINVEPRIASEEFAAQRHLMEQVAEITGGKFYLVGSDVELSRIYADIDQLEKSTLPIESTYITPPKSQLPELYHRVSLYPYLIALGITCLFFSVLLEGTAMRRIP